MVTFGQTEKGYAHLWDDAKVTKAAEADKMAKRILAHKDRYLQIEHDIGVPWIMAAVIHMRESDLDFRTHMHNGDPLNDYTHHVPAGRPKVGHGPPFTFEESTDDAFEMPGKAFDKLRGQFTIELMLFCIEGYNGWGYLNKGNSPYVWSWTDEYHGGKYVADGVYDPGHWDEQPGCAAIMKWLAALDPDARKWTERRSDPAAPVPKDAVNQATRKERGAAAGGAVATGTGTGTVASSPNKDVGTKVLMSGVGMTVALIGLVVVVVAATLLYHKTQLLKQRMFGAKP
jgi:lysozyme family protein